MHAFIFFFFFFFAIYFYTIFHNYVVLRYKLDLFESGLLGMSTPDSLSAEERMKLAAVSTSK